MATFSFNSNIPATNNAPSADQPIMQANNASTAGWVAQDHYGFNNSGGLSIDGKHVQVSMKDLGAAPALSANIDGILYSQIGPDGSSWPFWVNSKVGSPFQIIGGTTGSSAGINGFSYLFGGILLQWGIIAPTSGNPSVLFATANINFPNNLFNVSVTRQRTTSSPGSSFAFWVDNTTTSTTGFTIINGDGHTYGYYWTAIGN